MNWKVDHSLHGRNSSIELLRILLMYAVFFWHVLVHGGHITQIGADSYQMHGHTLYELLVCCILCVAVDCYIFISGYFGIKFKWKTLIGFVLMGLFYSVGTYIAGLFMGLPLGEGELYKALCPITGNLWWFFTDYLILYIVSGYLNKWIEGCSVCKGLYILMGTYLTMYVYHLAVGKLTGQSAISQPFNMIVVYLLGRYLKEHGDKLRGKLGAILYIGCQIALAAIVLILFYVIGESNLLWHVYTNGNPLVIGSAVGLFYMFSGWNVKRMAINRYAGGVFAIYLCTDAFLSTVIYENAYELLCDKWWLLLLLTPIVGSLIVGLEIGRKKITKKFFIKLGI